MPRIPRAWCASASAIALSSLLAAAAHAQEAATTAEVPTAADEIVVTAQKRSENVQRVPISITAFNSTGLAKANVRA